MIWVSIWVPHIVDMGTHIILNSGRPIWRLLPLIPPNGNTSCQCDHIGAHRRPVLKGLRHLDKNCAVFNGYVLVAHCGLHSAVKLTLGYSLMVPVGLKPSMKVLSTPEVFRQVTDFSLLQCCQTKDSQKKTFFSSKRS